MSERTYTQEEVDNIINNVTITERYMANQLMGDLGIPVERRVSPDGKLIYAQAAQIVMNRILAPAQKKAEPTEEQP
jgi:hypothetical protein